MSDCPQELAIAVALAQGELPEELRLHLAGCAVCGEVQSVAARMLRLAHAVSEEPRPSAAGMWWRLNLRMRQEHARRAQMPLIWMGRVFYAMIALATLLSVTLIARFSGPAGVIGLAALSAVALPAAITLWGWSRATLESGRRRMDSRSRK